MFELILDDCMKFLPIFEDNQFQLAIVDPDYGVYDGEKTGFMKKRSDSGTKSLGGIPGKEYFDELFRVSKNQIIWGCQYFTEFLPSFSQLIIWDKGTGGNYFADGEAAFCSIKGTLRIFKHQWCGAFKDSERGEKVIHPTQKPVELYRWLLKNYAKKGDKILDTHCGSASSLIACIDMGFDSTAFEINPKYYHVGIERLKNYKEQLKLY